MIRLEFTEREAEELKIALAVRLVGMREELVRTDDRTYRAGLKADLERLEAVLLRLEQAIAGIAPTT